MRDRKVVDPDGRLNGEELGGVDGEKKNSKKDVLYEKNGFNKRKQNQTHETRYYKDSYYKDLKK